MATKTKPKKPTTAANAVKPRVRKKPRYYSFKPAKRIKHSGPPLPNSYRLLKKSLKIMHKNRVLFAGILFVYSALNIILVRGFGSTTNIGEVKDALSSVSAGSFDQIGTAIGLFSTLLGSAGNNTNDLTGAYQVFLTLIASLALIWALRQVYAGLFVRVRDAFYKGMYPLVLFILVLAVILLQLLPIIVGNVIFNIVMSNDIAATSIEKALWVLIFGLFIILSIYMISSSIFALYIVTLPDMTPLKALRSARSLVLHRRWSVMRKIVILPVFLLFAAALIIVPLIIFAAPLAEWAFFLFSIIGLAILHSYMYTLYRELL